MSQTSRSKMTVQIYEQFPRRRSDAATHQFTLKQVEKYLSSKPLRRAPTRNPMDMHENVPSTNN